MISGRSYPTTWKDFSYIEKATNLSHLFDYFTTNMDHDLVLKNYVEIPIVGDVEVSYFIKENHLAIYTKSNNTRPVWSICIEFETLITLEKPDFEKYIVSMFLDALNKSIGDGGK